MSQATTSEEYKHLLTAQRLILSALESGDDKLLGAKAQGTRALCDVIRLKRDMRGVPDPKPIDVSQVPKRRRHREPNVPTITPTSSTAQLPESAPTVPKDTNHA